jgi:hypothetical protein
MRKILLSALLVASFSASAATPGEIQSLINSGECSDALVSLQTELNANPNKQSDLMDAMMVEAGLCDGRINGNNRGYALKTLAAIEKRNPMLVGLDAKAFNELREKVLAIDNLPPPAQVSVAQANQQPSSSSGDHGLSVALIFLVLLALTIFGFRFIAKGDPVFNQSPRKELKDHLDDSAINNLRNELASKANDLYQTINNKLDKARLSDNEPVAKRLSAFSDTVSSLIVDIQKMDTLSDLAAAKSKLSNMATMVKVA